MRTAQPIGPGQTCSWCGSTVAESMTCHGTVWSGKRAKPMAGKPVPSMFAACVDCKPRAQRFLRCELEPVDPNVPLLVTGGMTFNDEKAASKYLRTIKVAKRRKSVGVSAATARKLAAAALKRLERAMPATDEEAKTLIASL